MIHEIACLTITPGSEAAFEAAVAQAMPLFQQASGALSLRLDRTIESPNEYILTVGWEKLEDHMVLFRASAEFQQWRAIVGPYFVSAPHVRHVQHAYLGF